MRERCALTARASQSIAAKRKMPDDLPRVDGAWKAVAAAQAPLGLVPEFRFAGFRVP